MKIIQRTLYKADQQLRTNVLTSLIFYNLCYTAKTQK